ncbi:unnamed protein product [Lathyrus oleraceus]
MERCGRVKVTRRSNPLREIEGFLVLLVASRCSIPRLELVLVACIPAFGWFSVAGLVTVAFGMLRQFVALDYVLRLMQLCCNFEIVLNIGMDYGFR